MLPGSQKRKTKNSSKVNLLISLTFHGILVLAVLYFAARQGWMGKAMNKIAVEMVREKPKVPEKPKELPKPKVDEAKVDEPKPAEVAKVEAPRTTAPPPPSSTAPPAVAPPPAEAPSFDFEGGKIVESSSDPVKLYKGLLETSLRFNWTAPAAWRPHQCRRGGSRRGQNRGNYQSGVEEKFRSKTRDESVRLAIASTKKVIRPPPTVFPPGRWFVLTLKRWCLPANKHNEKTQSLATFRERDRLGCCRRRPADGIFQPKVIHLSGESVTISLTIRVIKRPARQTWQLNLQ